MSFKSFQKEVDTWVSQYKVGYFTPHENLAVLIEEVGELAREISHRYGPKKPKPNERVKEMKNEMGDIIFTLCCIANREKINLDEAFRSAMKKCYSRDKNRYEKK